MSRRLRVALLVLAGAALVPAVLPFTVDTGDADKVCVPAAHGWRGERDKPSEADLSELEAGLGAVPSPEVMADPAGRAAWLAAEAARTSTPGYRRAEAYVEWRAGDGACVPESRHRLILTGAAAGVLAVVAAAARHRLRAP